MRRACLVRSASLRTLGNMFQTIALTRNNSSSQMKRKMSLKVESSKRDNREFRLVKFSFSNAPRLFWFLDLNLIPLLRWVSVHT